MLVDRVSAVLLMVKVSFSFSLNVKRRRGFLKGSFTTIPKGYLKQ